MTIKPVWILIPILGLLMVGAIFSGILSPNEQIQEDSVYSESVSIKIAFPEITNFTLFLPTIIADGSLTPSLQDLNSSQIQTTNINNSLYLKITGNQRQFNWSNSIQLPTIKGNGANYETFLINHRYSGQNTEIADNSFLVVLLYAQYNASVVYDFEAHTNMCGLSSVFLGSADNQMQLSPGTTKIPFGRDPFLKLCALYN